MKILLEPNCDDAVLFAAYTLMVEKPLVISWENEECTTERKRENIEAMKLLGVDIVFIKDLNELYHYMDADVIYAPSPKCCHKDHKELAKVANLLSAKRVCYYSTYESPKKLKPEGLIKLSPTKEMEELKLEALKCYKSQIKKTPKHFELKDKSEYYD